MLDGPLAMLAFAIAAAALAGCTPAATVSAPTAPTAPTAPAAPMAPMSSTPAPTSASEPRSPVVDGELRLTSQVLFEVRPLSGPGTMGPTVLSPKSDAALEEVRAYLAAHPEAGPLRIEYGINPTRMGSSPDAKWPAGLALQVARWLVEHGIPCTRLEVVGWLSRDLAAPVERVRFYVGGKRPTRPPGDEAQLETCPVAK